MKKKLNRNMVVLEFACGTGILSVQLAGRIKIRLMEFSGFKVFHKWTPKGYLDFLKKNGFEITCGKMFGGDIKKPQNGVKEHRLKNSDFALPGSAKSPHRFEIPQSGIMEIRLKNKPDSLFSLCSIKSKPWQEPFYNKIT